MGRESMSRYGNFGIHLDSLNYSPGDQVNGVIYLDCHLDFPASFVTLKLEGKEKTKWWDSRQVYNGTDSNGNTQYRTEWYPVYNYHRCYRYKFPIASFKGAFIPKGNYEVPFSFKLPNSLPSTFRKEWYHNGDCYGKIHYECKALLESNFGKDLLKRKLPFTVNAGLIKKIEQKSCHIDKEVINCCCCKQGKFKMSAYFEKDAYVPGEIAYMVVEAENNTKVKCFDVSGIFSENVTLHGYGYGGDSNCSNLITVSTPGLAPGQSFTGEQAKRLQIP